MKIALPIYLVLGILTQYSISAQNIQFHYDFRHSIDPELNRKNYSSLSFEYFKELDSLGSFLFKAQSDLNGEDANIGQTYIQVSQTIKFWEPEVFLSFRFSGGLGVASSNYGYYLVNNFGLGVSYPFQCLGAYFNLNVQYRYTAYEAPSHDPQFVFYFWKGLFNYRLAFAGSMVMWTENRNQGTGYNPQLTGKKFAFFGDPQIWLRIKGGFLLGSRINLYYNLIGDEKKLKVYPTFGAQYKF
jgi:hypothetical protein